MLCNDFSKVRRFIMTKKNIFILIAFLIALSATIFRGADLSSRPMHLDEAVQANLTQDLVENGVYEYNKQGYHGPTLQYASFVVAKLTGSEKLKDISETQLRAVLVIAGVLLVITIALLYDGLGKKATLLAMLFAAISPAFVYYSRYYIHEMLLAASTMILISGGWRAYKSHKLGWKIFWALVAGLGLGLMDASKETWIITLGAMGLAIIALAVINRKNLKMIPVKKTVLLSFIGVTIFVITVVALFSSFGSNPEGVKDSILTYETYLHRGAVTSDDSNDAAHNYPFNFYFNKLLSATAPGWHVSAELIILIFAIIGLLAACIGKKYTNSKTLGRFLAIYGIVLALIYSALPYKTPWCLVQFYLPMVLLAGVGVAWLYELICSLDITRASKQCIKGGYSILVGVGLAAIVSQSITINYGKYSSDPKNPYVYVHTSPDVFEILGEIEKIRKLCPDKNITVDILTENAEYWPLWWYLRGYENVAYYDSPSKNGYRRADVIIATPELGKHFSAWHFNSMDGMTFEQKKDLPSYYFLNEKDLFIRPGVKVNLMTKDKWYNLLQTVPDEPNENK